MNWFTLPLRVFVQVFALTLLVLVFIPVAFLAATEGREK
jgi:hypothetical protein